MAYCGWIKGNPCLSLKRIHYAPTGVSLCVLQVGSSARLVQFPGLRSGSKEMSDTVSCGRHSLSYPKSPSATELRTLQ